MSEEEIFRVVEGILFVSNEPVHIKGIASAIDKTVVETNTIMEKMIERYESDESRGIKIVRADEKFQLVTKQNIFGYLTKVDTALEKPRISPAMLETLAIIAYKQPITKLEIESIRGVKSDYIVNKLLEYELVCEVGRADKIGRPILFGTTDKFLIYFGLRTLEELPKVAETKGITKDNVDEEILKLKKESDDIDLEVDMTMINKKNEEDSNSKESEIKDESCIENASDNKDDNKDDNKEEIITESEEEINEEIIEEIIEETTEETNNNESE